MSIYTGCNFEYANLASETFDLMIASIDGSIGESSSTGKSFDIIEDSIPNSFKNCDYGIRLKPHLEFDITFAKKHQSQDGFSIPDRSRINAWLFGRQRNQEFIIYRPDGQDIIFKCRFNNSNFVTVGSKCVGITCTVICDSPFGYTEQEKYNYEITTNNQIVNFYNLSEHEGSHYPEYLEIELQGNSRSISIINLSDNNYKFELLNLQANEKIYIDNANKIITRSSGLLALDNFNLNFLRFINGTNKLQFVGNSKIIIKTKFTIGMGG